MDKANNKELLQFILESISLIKKRFDGILNSDDFLASDDGLMRLDAISMRLQSIGEALKNIDKREIEIALRHPELHQGLQGKIQPGASSAQSSHGD